MRYIVIDKSYTAHCCFEASVVDSLSVSKRQYSDSNTRYDRVVCECFDIEEAQMIADALNRAM